MEAIGQFLNSAEFFTFLPNFHLPGPPTSPPWAQPQAALPVSGTNITTVIFFVAVSYFQN